MSAFGMSVNIDHCTRMDCAVPYYFIPSAILVPWPEAEHRFYAIIRPFETEVCTSA